MRSAIGSRLDGRGAQAYRPHPLRGRYDVNADEGGEAGRSGRMGAIAICAAAIALLAGMDACVKHLALTNHVLVVTFGRYFFGTVFAFGVWWAAGRPVVTRVMWRAHAIRGVVIAMSATSFFYALTVLPLAEAVTLGFVAPLVVPFVARVMLGEPIRPESLVAAAVGFGGVIIAVQGAPSAAQTPEHAKGVAPILFAATTYAVSLTLLRERAQAYRAPIVNLMGSLVPGIILIGPGVAAGIGAPPNFASLPFFLLLGIMAASGMFLMARAYAGAEAQWLAPVGYTELIWAAIYGYVLFNETPRLSVWAGTAVIIAACLHLVWTSRPQRLRTV
jgi:S-adenosylmethionine uptake transporter